MALDYSRPRRDYRPSEGGNDTPRSAAPERAPEPARTPERAPEPAPEQKGTFVPITGLFPSKSGKADTVFIKDEEILKKLRDIRIGDTLGVSVNSKTKRLMLWFIAK